MLRKPLPYPYATPPYDVMPPWVGQAPGEAICCGPSGSYRVPGSCFPQIGQLPGGAAEYGAFLVPPTPTPEWMLNQGERLEHYGYLPTCASQALGPAWDLNVEPRPQPCGAPWMGEVSQGLYCGCPGYPIGTGWGWPSLWVQEGFGNGPYLNEAMPLASHVDNLAIRCSMAGPSGCVASGRGCLL